MFSAYLGLGSNIGNREETIKKAIALLEAKGVHLIKSSRIIETEPVGGPKQNNYLNAVIEVHTSLLPHELLSATQEVEEALGRVRDVKNGPRTMDIDILLYEDEKIETQNLIVPHPRMKERRFVMDPLKEIAPEKYKELRA